MAFVDLGTVRPGTTLYIPFHTFDSNDPSASVTMTGLATTDIEIYKDGSVTQRASDTGYALLDTDGIDFDAITGVHGISIDLSSNATAGFYSAGSQYWVVVASITVDAATINFLLATFRIGYPDAVINTTIATLASQTSFTLTVGPAEDDALNGCVVCIHDVASAVQLGFAVVQDYTGSTKTVTLTAGVTFTAAATDNIAIYPPANTQWTGTALDTAQTGDSFARIGAPAGASIAADLVAIEAQTDDIGAAGAGLTAIPWNAAWDAEVESEVDDALGAGTGTALTAIPWNAAWDAEVQSECADALNAEDGANFTAVPWNAAWDAEVESEVVDALETRLILRRNTAQAGGASTITLDAGANATDNYYKNLILGILSGTGAGQGRIITAYVGATKVATVNTAWVTQPGADSVFVLLPFDAIPGATAPTAGEVADAVWDEAQADHVTAGTFGEVATETAAILVDTGTTLDGRIPAALVSGRMDASVGAMATGVVTATAIAADAIGASELAADAITEIVNGVWDEATAGHATAGTTGKALTDAGGAGTPLTAQEIANAVWDEPSTGHVASNTTGQQLRQKKVQHNT